MQSKCFLKVGITLLRLAYVMLLGIEYISQGPKWWYRGIERTLRSLAPHFEDIAVSLRRLSDDVLMDFIAFAFVLCWLGIVFYAFFS